MTDAGDPEEPGGPTPADDEPTADGDRTVGALEAVLAVERADVADAPAVEAAVEAEPVAVDADEPGEVAVEAPVPEPDPAPAPAADDEAEREPAPDPVIPAEPEPAVEPDPEPAAATDVEPEGEPEPEPAPDPAAEPEADAEPEPEPEPDWVQLSGDVASLVRSVGELGRLQQRATDHVAELHAENQRLRAGELAQATAPLVRDVMRLCDEVDQLLTACAPEARADLGLVRSRLVESLARWGVTPLATEPGEAFDPTRHQGIGRVATDEHPDGTIATVRKPGFVHEDGRVLRAAEVEVYKHEPAPEGARPSPGDGED